MAAACFRATESLGIVFKAGCCQLYLEDKERIMKLFITGASGFIGGAIAKALSPSYAVRAMARSEDSARKIKALGAVPVICDLTTVTEGDLQGTDIVIHAAARAEDWGAYEAFFKSNVIGTRHLLDVARRAGVKRFIHIGTEAALFRGQDLIDVDESMPCALDSPFPYAQTKALAEQAVLEANQAGFETLSIRPRMVWGPEDQSILPAICEMIDKGSFVWINQGQAETSTTHIDNVVHAVTLALSKGQPGEAYFVSDAEVSRLKPFFSQLIATAGVEVPDKSLPAWLLQPVAWLVDRIWRLFNLKSKPPITLMAVAMMRCNCTLNIDKARAELGYQPVMSVAEGMQQLQARGASQQGMTGMLAD